MNHHFGPARPGPARPGPARHGTAHFCGRFLLVASLVSVPAIAGELTRAELAALDAVWYPTVEQVSRGDGTWQFALPEGFDPDTRIRGNIYV